jgi:hypothetical protein
VAACHERQASATATLNDVAADDVADRDVALPARRRDDRGATSGRLVPARHDREGDDRVVHTQGPRQRRGGGHEPARSQHEQAEAEGDVQQGDGRAPGRRREAPVVLGDDRRALAPAGAHRVEGEEREARQEQDPFRDAEAAVEAEQPEEQGDRDHHRDVSEDELLCHGERGPAHTGRG